jgi:hypothetical protein
MATGTGVFEVNDHPPSLLQPVIIIVLVKTRKPGKRTFFIDIGLMKTNIQAGCKKSNPRLSTGPAPGTGEKTAFRHLPVLQFLRIGECIYKKRHIAKG